MSLKILLACCLFISQFTFAQSSNYWIRFYDSKTNLSGYKDLAGNIKIPAKLGGFTNADKFYNIMTASENQGDSIIVYYLLKNGKKVGRDSVFSFDGAHDCESEGKILFKDRKKDRVGYFNKNGIVIIPATYNIATPFYNGLAMALRNAKHQCWDTEEDTLTCEHLSWVGGEVIMINDKNEILADSLNGLSINNINWYSLKINSQPVDTSIWVSMKGKNGNLYSFIDYEKEFTKWFYTKFLPVLKSAKKDKLNGFLFSEITFWSNKNEWTSLTKNEYLKSFPGVFTNIQITEKKQKQISINEESLNEFIFDGPQYKKFYTACGSHNKNLFPLFEVQLGNQASFEFIRTNVGYQIISVSMNQLQK